MNVLHPAHLALLAGVAVPVIYHFLARANVVDRPFPTLRFLLAAKRRAGAGFRFRRLLLLLARALALAALALALARPFVTRPLPAAEAAGHFVLVLDPSLSMTARAGGSTLFERARADLARLVDAATPADRFALLATDAQGAPLPPPDASPLRDPFVDRAAISAPLAAAAPGCGRFDPARALRDAYGLLDGKPGLRRVVLASDFQKSDFGAELPPPPSGISLSLVDAKPDGARPVNLRPLGFTATPASPPAHAACRLAVAVENPGDAERELPVTFATDPGEGPAVAIATLPAGGTASPAVERTFTAEGPVSGSVDLAARDDLPGDDVRYFRLAVLPTLYALVLAPEGESGGAFLRAALNPGDSADPARALFVQAVDARYGPDLPALDPFDFVVANTPPEADRDLARRLADFTAAGGNLLLLADGVADIATFNATYGDLLPAPAVSFEGRSGSTLSMFSIASFDGTHPLFRRYDGADFSLDDFRFFRVLDVDLSRLRKDATVIAEFAKGLPALIERRLPSGGRILLLLSGLSMRTSTAPYSLQFVPFVQELARHLKRAAALVTATDAVCGEPIRVTLHRPDLESCSVTGPAIPQGSDGRALPLAPALAGDDLRLATPPVARPGIYTVTVKAGSAVVNEKVAVNTPPSESILDYARPADLSPAAETGSSVAGVLPGDRMARIEVNGWLFALFALLVALETLLTAKMDREAP